MWMPVRPATVNILLKIERPSDDGGDPAKRKEYISFQVLPTDDRDYLDLDTGEVFQHYNYARIRNKQDKLIGAKLTVEPASDDSSYKWNRMRYSDAVQGEFDSFPATIFFSVYVAPDSIENWPKTRRTDCCLKRSPSDLSVTRCTQSPTRRKKSGCWNMVGSPTVRGRYGITKKERVDPSQSRI
jgi:hypothetical protein